MTTYVSFYCQFSFHRTQINLYLNVWSIRAPFYHASVVSLFLLFISLAGWHNESQVHKKFKSHLVDISVHSVAQTNFFMHINIAPQRKVTNIQYISDVLRNIECRADLCDSVIHVLGEGWKGSGSMASITLVLLLYSTVGIQNLVGGFEFLRMSSKGVLLHSLMILIADWMKMLGLYLILCSGRVEDLH